METDKSPEFSIDVQENNLSSSGSVQLPLNFAVNGEIENDDVKVYIHQGVYKEIERYSHSDITRELGTILLGDYSEYSGKIHVVVSAFIEAKYTDASASTLTFTHETWDYVHKEHERQYPSLKILGWQHTHPGYGIFLSNYDMFIQENFFNLPFQIAYVVDPKQDFRGFFQWKNGNVEKLRGYNIYDEVGKKISAEVEQKKTDRNDSGNSGKLNYLLLALLFMSVFASSIFFGLRIHTLSSQQDALEAAISTQKDNYRLLQEQLSGATVGSGTISKIGELSQKVASQQSKIDEQDKTITELKELLESSNVQTRTTENAGDNEVTIVFQYYNVEGGDTLKGICAKFGIDYHTNKSIIMAINGIEDPSRIYAGQVLLLPKKLSY